LSRNCWTERTITTPKVSNASNKPIVTCLGYQFFKMEFITITNTLCVPLLIQRSKVQMVNTQVANVGYTYSTKVFCINANKTFSTKTFQDGKTIDTTCILTFGTKWTPQSSMAKTPWPHITSHLPWKPFVWSVFL